MSVEDRIRAGLAREADLVDPSVELAHVELVRRHHRRRRARVSSWTVGVATAAAAAFLVVLGLDPLESDEPTPVAEPSAVQGRYVVDVAATAESRSAGVTGRWVFVLEKDGSLQVIPPAEHRGSVSGAAYEVEGELLRTDALLQEPGCQVGEAPVAYRWRVDRDTLWLTPVGDDCPARRIVFASQPWERVR